MGNKGNDMWGNWKGWSHSSDEPRTPQKGHSDAGITGSGGTSNKGCARVIALPVLAAALILLFIL